MEAIPPFIIIAALLGSYFWSAGLSKRSADSASDG
jgi:hypothetical protein